MSGMNFSPHEVITEALRLANPWRLVGLRCSIVLEPRATYSGERNSRQGARSAFSTTTGMHSYERPLTAYDQPSDR